MNDKFIHNIVVFKHGNQYSVIGLKHITRKKHITLIQHNQMAPVDKGVFVHLKCATW